MYRIIKHKWEEKSKLYFSSDFHAYHNPNWPTPIWETRGHLNAQDSAEKMLVMINNTVPEDGILYFLGDGFLNATDELCMSWLKSIKCRTIRYLWGNHESNMYRIYKTEVLKQFGRDDIEVYPLRIANVEFMGNHLEIHVGKQMVILNHFPYRIFHKSHRGAWNLSGHSHLNDPQRRPEFPLGKGLDVGIDYGKIWSFDDIQDIMSTKDTEMIDHHDERTN
jgi:calcineurin-like phosphoesterase family protein